MMVFKCKTVSMALGVLSIIAFTMASGGVHRVSAFENRVGFPLR